MIGELTILASPVTLQTSRWYQNWSGTNRMGDEAATPVLYFREDVAWHQTRGGAAQDDIFSHKTLYLLEDALLDLKLLKYTLLVNTCAHTHIHTYIEGEMSHTDAYKHKMSCGVIERNLTLPSFNFL